METQKMKKLLTTREAAEFLRMQPQTLRIKRMKNEGPDFIRIPGGKNQKILYTYDALIAYLGFDQKNGNSERA
jgi:hypothetical protein